jgi:trehalose/maltose hydrolase-like predicted phosphorylase
MDAETSVSDDLESWLAPTPDRAWQLVEDGYDPAREAEIETWFAIGNGLLGVRASRAISRGATWVTYQHHLNWASWPRTYIAGLFDTPNVLPPVPGLVPAPDWLRLRLGAKTARWSPRQDANTAGGVAGRSGARYAITAA